uniref:N(6)-adenine-specific DNA methyltransferase 2 n=1 Tax=Aegilops tauschii subsp. strangulata TaxID=200361 RepID=A0A453LTX1_AEGTS
RKSSPDVPARLLEYDERFGQYGDDFAFYDYNQPEALPPAMKHAFSIVVADPPYLSQECLEKVAKTVSFLARPEGSFLLLLTEGPRAGAPKRAPLRFQASALKQTGECVPAVHEL